VSAREAGHIDVEVLLGARDREPAQAAAGLLVDEGLAVKSRVLDVTPRGSIVAAIEAIDSGDGRLGILVNDEKAHPLRGCARRVRDRRFAYCCNLSNACCRSSICRCCVCTTLVSTATMSMATRPLRSLVATRSGTSSAMKPR